MLTPSDKRILLVFLIAAGIIILLSLIGCRSTYDVSPAPWWHADALTLSVGWTDGTGTTTGPLTAGSPPKGPPTSGGTIPGQWDTDGHAWGAGLAWTWDLLPRRVVVVSGAALEPPAWDAPPVYDPPRRPEPEPPAPEPLPAPETPQETSETDPSPVAVAAPEAPAGEPDSVPWQVAGWGGALAAVLAVLKYRVAVMAALGTVYRYVRTG
jgi:hypothetical protein